MKFLLLFKISHYIRLLFGDSFLRRDFFVSVVCTHRLLILSSEDNQNYIFEILVYATGVIILIKVPFLLVLSDTGESHQPIGQRFKEDLHNDM